MENKVKVVDSGLWLWAIFFALGFIVLSILSMVAVVAAIDRLTRAVNTQTQACVYGGADPGAVEPFHIQKV